MKDENNYTFENKNFKLGDKIYPSCVNGYENATKRDFTCGKNNSTNGTITNSNLLPNYCTCFLIINISILLIWH